MAVNVCVIGAGIAITPGISLYGASKHAVRGFTLTLAAELRDKGVAVTCICPGLVDTGMLQTQIDRPEGAISFTTGKPLTTQQISDAIQKAIVKRPVEVCLPNPFFAKLVNAFPGLGARLYGRFAKGGLVRPPSYSSPASTLHHKLIPSNLDFRVAEVAKTLGGPRFHSCFYCAHVRSGFCHKILHARKSGESHYV